MLELEAFELKKAKPEIAVQYDHHNLPKRIIRIWMTIFFCSRRRHVLDSGLADLETELATCTHGTFWQTRQNTLRFRAIRQQEAVWNACYGTGGLDVALAAAGEPYM
jgi:aconitate hydratase